VLPTGQILGAGVNWKGDRLEPPVAQMPHGADEFWQILLHRARQSNEVLTGLRESQISTRLERVLTREFQTHFKA